MLDRGQLHRYLQESRISLLDLHDEGLALWTSLKIGAHLVVLGSLDIANEKIVLSVRVARTLDGKVMARGEAEIPLDSNLKDLLTKPPPLEARLLAGLAVSCDPAQVTGDKFAAAGVSVPQCIYCPEPDYSEEARRRKLQDSVTMDVVVGTDRRPASIHVRKGAPCGLEEQAIEAVRTWYLRPAMKDGKAVPVCMSVVVTFRIL